MRPVRTWMFGVCGLFLSLAALGCGGTAPVTVSAADEEAIRSEMSMAETAERERQSRRSNRLAETSTFEEGEGPVEGVDRAF